MKKKKRTKKRTSKKKTIKKNSNKIYIYIIVILLLILSTLLGFLLSYIILQKKIKQEIKTQKNVIQTLEKKIKELEKENKKHKTISSESYDYQLALKQPKQPIITHPKEKPIKKHPNIKKPMLVIILDDVSFKNQVNEIKSLPFKVTPSFFPPTKRHPNTAIYAKEFPVYMVHLPLQAIHFSKPEPNTLNVGDSYSKIKARIDYIKKLFPRVKFVNNHTGSTFTANENSMILLFKALKSDNLGFVDSRTTPYTKSYIAETFYKIPLFSRNVFIDNKTDIHYIKTQLKKAVKIAKKRGYAIAIGHPHKTTFEALKESANILKSVKVVYINELAKYTDR